MNTLEAVQSCRGMSNRVERGDVLADGPFIGCVKDYSVDQATVSQMLAALVQRFPQVSEVPSTSRAIAEIRVRQSLCDDQRTQIESVEREIAELTVEIAEYRTLKVDLIHDKATAQYSNEYRTHLLADGAETHNIKVDCDSDSDTRDTIERKATEAMRDVRASNAALARLSNPARQYQATTADKQLARALKRSGSITLQYQTDGHGHDLMTNSGTKEPRVVQSAVSAMNMYRKRFQFDAATMAAMAASFDAKINTLQQRVDVLQASIDWFTALVDARVKETANSKRSVAQRAVRADKPLSDKPAATTKRAYRQSIRRPVVSVD